jgi:hypothetical protein
MDYSNSIDYLFIYLLRVGGVGVGVEILQPGNNKKKTHSCCHHSMREKKKT